ncbi:response regulator [Sphingobacterium hungaricum]
MTKNNKYRIQITLSIVSAYLLIVLSFFYFFNQLTNSTDYSERIIQITGEKLALTSQLHGEVSKVIQQKALFIQNNNRLNLNSYSKSQDSIQTIFARLNKSDEVSNENSSIFKSLKTNIDSITDLENFKQISSSKSSQELTIQLVSEQQTARNLIDSMDNDLLKARDRIVFEKHKDIQKAKIITISAIIVALFIIFYVLYKVIKALNFLRESAKNEFKLNKELKDVSKKVESANWVLEHSTILYEKLNGIDDERKICDITIQTASESLSSYASAIYIRKIDSYEFHLRAEQGLANKNENQNSFLEGEGFLGSIVKNKEHRIISLQESENYSINTTFIGNFPAQVILFPLVHENQCIGLLEVVGKFNKINQPSLLEYLKRIARNIATAIKFGQSHKLVENLLEETQRQTEELEAQQEELRITNEELIYKTNLLESSEEELRVQQEELSHTNFELTNKASELERRNLELNNAQKIVEQKIAEVEQASSYKSEFMANMSHELRTPLNSVLILAKLLQDNKKQNLTAEQVKYASVIHSAGSDLLELINELLDLAKIESGKVELNMESINAADFTNELHSLFKEIALQKNIEFTTTINAEIPKDFVTDEYRLQQILKNFLSNAFKFTEKSGKVDFSIDLKNDNLHFTVRDNGKGISGEKKDLIFEAFRQEDGSTSRKYGGTGLGLSISKEIASLLGGRIILESELEVGSSFTLVIPYQTEIKAETKIEIDEKPPTKETPLISKVDPMPIAVANEGNDLLKRILIIEDDTNFADILKTFAENYGFEVKIANDGVMGIKLAKQDIPDAIILDVMLPLTDGWEVLRTLKNDADTKHIPIHMMSAASLERKEFIEKGAIGFMAKPVSENSIKETFKTISLNISTTIKNVLLIEDQELQSDFIKNSFTDQNINVIQAFTAESALTKLNDSKNIDCIIMDLNLPDVTGLELLDEIKSIERYAEIPIIINTAYELTPKQTNHILSKSRAMVIKTGKSNSRLIDEVNLFLNKINTENYQPIKNTSNIVAKDGFRPNNLKGKKILVVDDDMRNVFALTTSLENQEMTVEVANNGKEAVDFLEDLQNKVDIVLMDIMMPEMDGYEAIEIIRKNKALKNLPIIAVTAKAMKGDREKSIQLGANDYVSKPIDMDKLISLMQVWIS